MRSHVILIVMITLGLTYLFVSKISRSRTHLKTNPNKSSKPNQNVLKGKRLTLFSNRHSA